MNILIGPLRFVPFAADIPVSLLVAVHFEQRVERLEVGGEIGDVVLQEQGVLLGKGDLQPGEHVVAPGKGAGDIRGYVFVVGETQVRIHDAVGGGEVALEETRAVIHISRISSHAAQNVVGGLHDGAHGGLCLRREAGQLAFKFREGSTGCLHGRRFIRGGGWFWLRFRFGLGCQFRRTLAGQGPEDALSPGEEGAKQHGKRQGKGLPH